MNRRRFLRVGAALAGGALCRAVTPLAALRQARRPMRDVIVVLPGIMGSVLQKNGRDVWALSGTGLLQALRTLGRSVADLALAKDSDALEDLGDGVVAQRLFPDTHLVPGLWKIDGYSQLTATIAQEFDLRPNANYFEFPYDWRRDNRAAARRLERVAPQWLRAWRKSSSNPDAQLILIAHSMGGLVSRYFLEVLGGWRDTRMLITFGTPYRGSLKALNFLANGYKTSVGSFTVADLTSLVRSFTSVYQLLPIYPCYDPGDGRLRRLVESGSLPNVDATRLKAAFAFHDEMTRANQANSKDPAYLFGRYTLHTITGTYQATYQIARRAGSVLEMLDRHPAADVRGDGTVPQQSATPIEADVLAKQHRSVYVAEVHGSLQNSRPMLDHVLAVLAQASVNDQLFRESRVNAIALSVDDLYSAEEGVRFSVASENPAALVIVTVTDVQSRREVFREAVDRIGPSLQRMECGRLPPGTYRIRASAATGGSATDVFAVA